MKIIEKDNLHYKKEENKNLQKEFKTKPIYGEYKIYIIKECEKLTENISNTILKFIEEPEEGIIAILLVENEYQLLSTNSWKVLNTQNINKIRYWYIVYNVALYTNNQKTNSGEKNLLILSTDIIIIFSFLYF